MIRITRQTDYGIALMARMASCPQFETHNARDLAKEFRLPLPMVSKTLKLLSKNGLLTSQRGSKGGYFLAKNPEEITVLEIISALDGPIALTDCSFEDFGNCKQEPVCPVSRPWQKINQVLREALGKMNLAEMTLATPGNFVPVAQLQRKAP